MSIVKLLLPISLLVAAASAYTYQKKIQYIPAGTYMTGRRTFIGGDPASPDAPLCRAEEPCGYYTFEPNTKRPLKWIPSWCQCSFDEDCVFARLNQRLRTYEHSCVMRTDVVNEGENIKK